MASRSTPYVNATFDFDCFASLSLPTSLSVSQVHNPMSSSTDALLDVLRCSVKWCGDEGGEPALIGAIAWISIQGVVSMLPIRGLRDCATCMLWLCRTGRCYLQTC